MRRATAIIIAVTAILFGLAVPASAALRPAELGSAEAVLKWINGYRANRDVASVPAAVKALSQLGAFKDPENAGVYVGFVAGVIGTSPKADDLVAKMLPIVPEDHWAIVRAIAYSSHPDWKGLLRRFVDRIPTRKKMIEQYLDGKLPTLTELSFAETPGMMDKVKNALRVDKYFKEAPPKKVELEPSPMVLDTLWGYYFATGAYGPIARIAMMLPWSKDKDDVEKLTVGSMAKYTLATNAARDSKLLFMLKASTQAAAQERSRRSRRGDRGGRDGRDRQDPQGGARRRRRAQAQGSGLAAQRRRVGPGGRRRDRGRLHCRRRGQRRRARHSVRGRRRGVVGGPALPVDAAVRAADVVAARSGLLRRLRLLAMTETEFVIASEAKQSRADRRTAPSEKLYGATILVRRLISPSMAISILSPGLQIELGRVGLAERDALGRAHGDQVARLEHARNARNARSPRRS